MDKGQKNRESKKEKKNIFPLLQPEPLLKRRAKKRQAPDKGISTEKV